MYKRKFTTRDNNIIFPISCYKVYGDVTITVDHATTILGTEQITTAKILQLRFHTAFVHLDQQSKFAFRFDQ